MSKSKNIYKIIDNKGRIYIPKELRTAAEMEPGDIVKLGLQKGTVTAKKVNLIEIGDQSPEAMEAYVRAALKEMSEETQINIAARILELVESRKGVQL
ncbi:AbrB/MazE/SpoVT family DNA-binding domain-containing protein [Ruminiclostridium cellulolyticum]|uniref:SpoVT/AbrB domain protein n=1 Tax=Ruminiclostridium cellulolyticum (strain ATCC 35319 / DSM 5812 / JCM 6584 / H10) TaxID=394503 RepID=B8I7L2_RUMCH|nr:AbrB/MazE/SpoVT family DNA-binding domain-containing protein [Ruminiclostridium cellulolyticum]ACL77083.1 SpoVT/AbrB domain protein [Ruminiclostridium cellulolyticum H10]